MNNRSAVTLVLGVSICVVLVGASISFFTRGEENRAINGTRKKQIVHKTQSINRIRDWETFRSKGNLQDESIEVRTPADKAFLLRAGHSVKPLMKY